MIQRDEFLMVKTGAGNVRLLTRGPHKGKYRVLSGRLRGTLGERIRLCDENHNVVVYVRPPAEGGAP